MGFWLVSVFPFPRSCPTPHRALWIASRCNAAPACSTSLNSSSSAGEAFVVHPVFELPHVVRIRASLAKSESSWVMVRSQLCIAVINSSVRMDRKGGMAQKRVCISINCHLSSVRLPHLWSVASFARCTTMRITSSVEQHRKLCEEIARIDRDARKLGRDPAIVEPHYRQLCSELKKATQRIMRLGQ